MSTEENKTVTRRFYEEVFERGNLAYADEVIVPDYIDHDPTNPMGNLDSLKQTAILMRTALPDIHVDLDQIIAEGFKVVATFTTKGTHTGPLMGPGITIPATGKNIAVTGIDIIQFVDGKVVEHWGEFDQLGMMQQLGLIPMPSQAPA